MITPSEISGKFAFPRNIPYADRKTKARFVFEKYNAILTGKILDVGADECYLKEYLSPDIEYKGVGLGNNSDLIKVDFEKEKIPFPSNNFNCVLCLDVLEHLENIHDMFDELCRVTKQFVIISLPNPYAEFMSFLQNGKYKESENLKFYGLPKERNTDRHKWFFSVSEAREFIKYRADKNDMKIIDLYIQNEYKESFFSTLTLKLKYYLKRMVTVQNTSLRADLNFSDLYEGTHWWVLKK